MESWANDTMTAERHEHGTQLMHRAFLLFPALVLFANPLGSVSLAAGIPIPIICGHGETVSEVGKLSAEAREEVAKNLGPDLSVGFLYSRVHVFYADLWTWDGRFVLYRGAKYWQPTDGQWMLTLGSSPQAKYGKPLLYRFPLGLVLLLSAIVLCTVLPKVFPSDQQKLEKLCNDGRCTKAVEMVLSADYALRTDYDRTRFEATVVSLTGQSISESKARRNLERLLTAVCEHRRTVLNSGLYAAASLAKNGSISRSLEILQELSGSLPPTDPQRTKVDQFLAKLHEDAAQGATPPDATLSEETK